MFTAYSIGVTVHLTNRVSEALRMISRDFASTGAQAAVLQHRLEAMRLNLGRGLILGGVGFLGLEAVKAVVKPAMEYAHQLNIMNNLGMTQKEVAEAVGVAWKNTGTVITTTATQNLRTLVDLRNILADKDQMMTAGRGAPIDMKMANEMLPVLTRLQAVLTASTVPGLANLGKDDRFIFEMAKTLDIRGAATDPVRFKREADMMARAMVGMQGRITPEGFKQAMIFARQEKFQLSDQFMYERGLPTLLLEQGGGGQKGIGPMLAALNRWFVQNIHGKGPTAEAGKLGLLEPGTKKMKGADLALTDPYALATELVLPAILKHLPKDTLALFAKESGKIGPKGTSKETTDAIIKHFPEGATAAVSKELGVLFRGNQLLADIMLRFIHQQANFIRDQQIIQKVLPMDTAYQQSLMRDPDLAFKALEAQWTNLKTAFGISVIPILIPALQTLATALNGFAMMAREHPALVNGMTYAFTALSGALMFSGAVYTLRAAFYGLSVIMTAIASTSAAIGTAGYIVGIAGEISAVATALGVLGVAALAFADTPLGRTFFPNWYDTSRRNDTRSGDMREPDRLALAAKTPFPVDPQYGSIGHQLWEGFRGLMGQHAYEPPGVGSGDMRERNAGVSPAPKRPFGTLPKTDWLRADGSVAWTDTTSPISPDMRERNAIPELTNVITGNMRDQQLENKSFLDRLGAIIKEGLAAGLSAVSINLDGAAVGRMMEERMIRRLGDPPRGGGGSDSRIMPDFPAIVN